MISIVASDFNMSHSDNFIVNRPFGLGVFDIIFFKTKTHIELEGEIVLAGDNSIIIFDRYAKQYYYSAEEILTNDYVHFDVDNGTEKDLFENLVLNKPFRVEHVESIRNLMWLINYEYRNKYPHRNDYLTRLIGVLIKKIEEEIELSTKRNTYGEYADIVWVQSRIIQNPTYEWNIKEIAESCNMSVSFFHVAYKKLFGTSCISDVIRARLNYSLDFIKNSDLPISKIASYCGYASTEHFFRQFKREYGMTPLQYRNDYLKNNELLHPKA